MWPGSRAVGRERRPPPLCVVVLVVCAGCRGSDPSERLSSERFIVLPDAMDVRLTSENDGGVVYRVADPYPADRTIRALADQLAGRGWTPLEHDPLNSDRPSSRLTGWGSHQERDGTHVDQWMASWRDPKGDVQTYSLQYRGPPQHARTVVEVRAAVLSAETLEILRRASDPRR